MRARISIEVDSITAALRRMPDRGVFAGKSALLTVCRRIAVVGGALAPKKSGALSQSVRTTKPVATKAVISCSVVAGGAGLLGKAGRGASAHVRAFYKAQASTRAHNVYAPVQEAGHERTRSGATVELHSKTGQAHFLERPALQLAPDVPGEVLAAIDRENG